MLPSPNTAVPFVMTATKLEREVYFAAASSPPSWIAIQAAATPGE